MMDENKFYVNNTDDDDIDDLLWFADDFEEEFKRSVPEHRSLALYQPKPKRFKKLFKSPVFAAVISSVLTCCLCLGIFSAFGSGAKYNGPTLPPVVDAGTAAPMATGGALTIPEVYDAVSPAVVTILCNTQSGGYLQSQMSSGSGIILRQDGYIVTNNHVISGASKIKVNTIAGQSFDATLVGADERTDLAVLKVETNQPLPYATLGDSSKIRVGEVALAIGNPLKEELAGTLTVGYISAINRSMIIDGRQMTMIQTDAAINPGNSGGALLNLQGHVIGINTAKSTGYDVEGLGFAIPVNEARPIIESIIENGYVTGRVVIGITGQDITEAIAEANDLPIGVYVREVLADSAAETAGIMAGDVITECDGKAIASVDEINTIRDTHKVGETMTMKIYRNGKNKTLKLTLKEDKPSNNQTSEPQTQQIPQQTTPNIPFPFSWFGW